MKGTKLINSVKSKARFHEQIVERYLQNNLPPSSLGRTKIEGLGNFSDGYRQIEFCAAETPVLGAIEIMLHPDFSTVIDKIIIPVKSRFFVSCIRDKNSPYKVAASASLS